MTSVLFFGTAKAQVGSGQRVDVGIEVDNTTLTVSFTPNVNFTTSPLNTWSNFVITIRWQAQGGTINPVSSMTNFQLLDPDFGIAEDPATIAPVLSGGYFYKKFAGAPFSPVDLFNGVKKDVFTIDFSTAAANLDFELITNDAYTNANNGNVAISTLMGNQFNTFAPAVATYDGSSFPVEWLYFNAEPVNSRDAKVSWATANEGNNDYFQIEKSVDGELFQSIAKVDGAGNSSEVKEYEYLDQDYVADKVFYRLKQVDYNGQFSYSEQVEVNFDPTLPNKVEFEMFPNPAVDFVTIKSTQRVDGNYRIAVIDMVGRQAWSGTFEGRKSTITIPVNRLAEGVYTVYMSGGQIPGNHLAGKFVKE
jgi:hypothetical protein